MNEYCEICGDETENLYECQSCGGSVCGDCMATCDFCDEAFCKSCFQSAKDEQGGGINIFGKGFNACYACSEDKLQDLLQFDCYSANGKAEDTDMGSLGFVTLTTIEVIANNIMREDAMFLVKCFRLQLRARNVLDGLVKNKKWREKDTIGGLEDDNDVGYSPELQEAIELLKELKEWK